MPTERFDKLSELKKNKISDVISEAFMHRGTGDIHIIQIAGGVRISRGSLYAHLLSKEDMLFFSLRQTQRSIWGNNKKILLEYGGDYWKMLETSLRYHFSIYRTNRLYRLLYLPTEGNGGFNLSSRSLLYGKEYMEYKAWIYRHLTPVYRERLSEDKFGVYQDTCNGILTVSIQEHISGAGKKEDIMVCSHNKIIYIKSEVKQQTVQPRERRSMMKKGAIVDVVAAVVIRAAVTLRFVNNKQFAKAVALPVMGTAYPQTGDIRLITSSTGKVEPSDMVYIYPRVAGDVTSVNVKAGDVVTEGQVICTIDTKQVETVKGSMEAAALTLKEVQAELGRQQILYNSGGILEQAYEQYRDKVDSARIQYEQVEFICKTQLEYSQITAPISGLVEICDMEVFDTVSQNNLICVIPGQGARVVSFSATERVQGYPHGGDEIEVEKEGVKGSGAIYEVSTMADSTAGLYKVEARLEDGDTFLTGSEVKLYVVFEKTEDAMTIPVDSIYYDNGNSYAYTCENGTVHKVFIETGIYDSETTEVLSGLTMEDQAIITRSLELYERAQVRVLGEEQELQQVSGQIQTEVQTQTTEQTTEQTMEQ